MRRSFGQWGKQVELFELLSEMSRDPDVLKHFRSQGLLQEADSSLLAMEGTGAPEGRADFPTLLAAIIRHNVREGFKVVESQWSRYVGIERAEDFREHTVSQLNGIRGMGPLTEEGNYPRLYSDEEEGPPYAVARHGGIYNISFELIVNDEVNRILNRTPTEMGRMAAAYVTRIVIALIESNPLYIDGLAFFHASRGNLRTGSAADPTETNLAQTVSNMKLRRNRANEPIDITPTSILTQNDITAGLIYRAIQSEITAQVSGAPGVRDFARGNKNTLTNLFPGADPVITDPWLNDADDYITMADPSVRPAFVAAFLRGQRAPFIGIKEGQALDALGGGGRDPYTWEGDGIEFKARHVLGAAVGEPLSATLSKP